MTLRDHNGDDIADERALLAILSANRREIARNRRAFILASQIAVILGMLAIAGWLKVWLG